MSDERKLTPLGVWIERYMKQHEMSERELARRMDYSHAQISRVKYGDVKPSPRFVRALSYATGASENELLIIAYGQPRVEAARAGAKRIMALSGAAQEALNGLARLLEPLPPDDQRMVIGWFKALANMSQSNRAKAIREITVFLENRH